MVEPGGADHGEQHPGLRILLVVREGLALRQHEVHAGGTHAADGADGAHQLALQRAGLVDFLLEVGRGEAVAAIEDFVADRTAGGQSLLRQHQAGFRHLVGRHQDLVAAGCDPVGDVVAAKHVHHLGGVARVEVAVQQRHLVGGAV